MTTCKIAIIGNGSAIAKGASGARYEVRTTSSAANQVRDAGSWGDIIVLAVPAPARADALKNLGNVEGKRSSTPPTC